MLELLKADLTTLRVDAVVNAANAALCGGGGVDGAIHDAAGPELLAACRALGRCPAGEAVVTPGFQLPARLVIHAVGPVWSGGTNGEQGLLAQVYERAFARAAESGVDRSPFRRSPPHEREFDRVIACLFDESMLAVYQRTLTRLRLGR